MTQSNRAAFLQGCQSALPIALGYIPVAIAFGMATTAAGFPTWVIVAMSLFIYAGASQFLLFASIVSGASALAVVGLCALLDSRHLLYAPLMKRHLKNSDGMVWVAPLITDEVFATSMAKLKDIDNQKPWLVGLALVSWTSWWGGTIVGIFGGKLLANYPTMSATMNFAFVALFVSLSTHAFISEPRFRIALIVSAIVAVICTQFGHGEIALLVAGFAGVLVQLIISRFIR
ncbi:AzlC family ABC transporter permease [Moraxella sp. FZLJ2107]|uniref:AzlC family ABC transporter permease n=1 Tax=unclassified Moraxella TaxID=2685852 RepID=UPI0020C8413F|nr:MULTISPECIES: AzlC family ABC transporter permease [unclassified Moraxella]UTO05893.1 AzlC family ABC transporter permease [Moraxella sp. FZLJ2107]UTO22629.1 AzlC family ABC transporter permease [Moraxella sp. FZLJ2109]